MKTVLVTGVSATGKSALARWLAEHGHHAVSLDGHPGLCDWVDDQGHSVPWPTQPDLRWLSQHRWVWRPEVLDAVITAAAGSDARVLFLCGRADNAPELAERFHAIIGLFIDSSTMTARLDEPSRGNPFGRMGDSRRFVIDNLDGDQRLLADWVDAIVDAGRPLAQVAEDVLSAAALELLRAKM
ncbi:hypothetical protein [Catellatospora chokoriensis]|uniref:Shikimate kinase n=1 Tax=Catellatospora chokoriensis TaxID=310353 RepID=A0A8J3JSX3_9ACTN|nr:hypothetical protein [Catellatospora chokoriensis]GIF90482.1 hypothetical protein Cch02nite_39260 [Catellatospora chokoriensis]